MSSAGSNQDMKQSILKQWIQNSKDLSTNRIIPTEPLGLIPLSFAQKRLWFLQQWMPDSSGYNLFITLRMQGHLEPKIMEDSFRDVIRRHAILRTIFAEADGEPYQVIRESSDFTLPWMDISELNLYEQDQKVKQIFDEEMNQLFDLNCGPLIRSKLIRLNPEEWLWSIKIHHIITDGWSNQILLEEVSAGYEARAQGVAFSLPQLSVQYYDYSRWQTDQFQKGLWNEHIRFWKKYLEGVPALMELPLDYPRPPVQTSQGAIYEFTVSEPTLSAFREFCLREKVTSVMVFQAVLKLLLYRYSGQVDLVMGLPVFNRSQQEIEKNIGFFVNTLAIRTRIPSQGEITFGEWLLMVRDSALSAYEHQELSFEKLVEIIQPERSLSHNPIIQVMLSIGAKSSEFRRNEGKLVHWSPFSYERKTANFDLTLEITEWGGTKFTFVYRTDLFKSSTIQRLADHFVNLLTQCIESPGQLIRRIPLMSNHDRAQIIYDWNQTKVEYPPLLLHQLIERQVNLTPEVAAVYFEGKMLTYRELNERANQLAHMLLEKGVQPEQLVGISMERSLEMIVGLLGILKAGAAYVPIDPNYPNERIRYMLEDSKVAFLLTQEHIELQQIQQLSFPGTQIWKLDTDWPVIANQPKYNPQCKILPQSVAYMIYTSGSTGRPKGAMNTHLGISNRLLWMQDEFKLSSEDRVLQKTPFSFDVSVWEFFWPLLAGASLYIARPEGHKDASYLIDFIQANRITTIHFVPSMLQVFLEDSSVSLCTSLIRVIVSGEALSYDLQQRFYKCLPFSVLYNLYGPTEAAVDVTFWKCEPDSEHRNIPIGRPVANTQIYILDCYLEPVPIGAAGELHIGGVQVGKGYYGRNELTRERFIANPFAEGYLYKTGDLARFTEEGVIEFLGRMDHQVKLRGLRIELGEIEAELLLHPKIREAVVNVSEVTPGEKQLVAYYTTHDSVPLDGGAIRSFLTSRLPEYMLPGFLIQLETLPLSPNGKIDRNSLPDPRSAIQQNHRPMVQPSTPLEITLATIWKEVLRLSDVGIQDNFFELGGHSLLVSKVRSKILEQCAVSVSMMDLFRYTTIESLARFMRSPAESDDTAIDEVKTRAQKQREAFHQLRGRR